jgi:prepilin-type N-terminal cleavage/methylation domain-containing protein
MRMSARAFNLIELMIVLIITGLLVAAGGFGYQRFLARSQNAEPAQVLSGFGTSVQTHWLTNRTLADPYTPAVTAATPDLPDGWTVVAAGTSTGSTQVAWGTVSGRFVAAVDTSAGACFAAFSGAGPVDTWCETGAAATTAEAADGRA